MNLTEVQYKQIREELLKDVLKHCELTPTSCQGPRGQQGLPGVPVVNLTEVQYKGQTTKNMLHCAAIMNG